MTDALRFVRPDRDYVIGAEGRAEIFSGGELERTERITVSSRLMESDPIVWLSVKY